MSRRPLAAARNSCLSLQALVFINDDGDATEEVLALKVSVT
jgi:hypothetical protein